MKDGHKNNISLNYFEFNKLKIQIKRCKKLIYKYEEYFTNCKKGNMNDEFT